MEWYVKIKDEIKGPYSESELLGLLTEGTIERDTEILASDTFRKLSDVFSASTDGTAGEVATYCKANYPWRRLFAFCFDVGIWSVLITITCGVLSISKISFVYGILEDIVFAVVYAFFLSSISTTPGKALLNISVYDRDGKKLPLIKAFKREFFKFLQVYFLATLGTVLLALTYWHFGIAGFNSKGIPQLLIANILIVFLVVSAATFYWQYARLKRTHQTSYDELSNSKVVCEKLTKWRIANFVVLFLGLGALAYYIDEVFKIKTEILPFLTI